MGGLCACAYLSPGIAPGPFSRRNFQVGQRASEGALPFVRSLVRGTRSPDEDGQQVPGEPGHVVMAQGVNGPSSWFWLRALPRCYICGLHRESQGVVMIVLRVKLQCQPGRTEDVVAACERLVEASRPFPGVIHYDIARDITDSNALIATEVYQDREAMERHESLAELAKIAELLQGGAAAGPPERTLYEVASSE